ncbi:tape measure domain-containing protein [Peptoniphilus olsenii]|uniref:Tape measure domain-containing protein n=1 Tax=Peptoniphilus olsenii TaxID=411570 RepID=A0ABV2J747_9FIRM
MGVLSSTIILKNQMTGVLNSITESMNMVISSAYDVETAGKKAFDVDSLNAARDKIRETQAAIQETALEQEKFNKRVEEGSKSADKLKGFIKSALITYGSFRSVKAFVGLSDEMTQIRARLDSINDGHQSTLELQNMIFESAQRARGEYKMTMDIVSKLGAQAKDAFASNKETIAFAENLNKLFTISGTSAQGVESVMYNLTQAMASGVLRGQDLNAVMSNTPQLIQIIADYMDSPIGQIRKLAEEGQLSADVVKNALLNASDDINLEFEKMPKTFGQIALDMKNRFVKNIEPALARLNEFANSEEFQIFADRAINGVTTVANMIFIATDIAIKGFNFIADHWGIIGPIIWGAVAAFGALELSTLELNAAFLSNPIFRIGVVIGVIIGLYLKWANSVGGVGVAHLIVMNNIKNYWADFVINNRKQISVILYQWDMFKIGIKKVKNGVLNTLDNMKVDGLRILTDMVNGAIGLINKLIGLVNNIPGVSIEAFDKVNLFAGAKVDAERNKKQRDDEIQSAVEKANENQSIRDEKTKELQLKYDMEKFEREKEIAKKQAEKLGGNKDKNTKPTMNFDIPTYTDMPGIAKDIQEAKNAAKGTKKNTEKLKDGLEVKNEDVSHLKDLLERRAIQNFTFEKLEVIANNSFGDIHETADLDGWMEGLTDDLAEAVESTMGGLPAYEH